MSKYSLTNPKPLPSQERLRYLLSYDPATGELTWENSSRVDLNGKPAGSKRTQDSYFVCTIDGSRYSSHRIIYKWMTGQEPDVIDHINGDPSDNAWHNLRSVKPKDNNLNCRIMKNNQTGTTGVFYHANQNRYHASVRIEGKSIHLGSFKTPEEASAARKAANKLLGFSDTHGRVA